MAELRMQTTVLPGHRVEVSTSELAEGTRVEVLIVPAGMPLPFRRSALEIIESLHGRRLFQTPQEAQRHLQEERNGWDR